jgi:hypothetical protein
LSFNVVLHVESRGIYGVSVSHFWHIVFFYPFLMVLRVGSPKGIIENEVGKKYKEFQDATFFLNK